MKLRLSGASAVCTRECIAACDTIAVPVMMTIARFEFNSRSQSSLSKGLNPGSQTFPLLRQARAYKGECVTVGLC